MSLPLWAKRSGPLAKDKLTTSHFVDQTGRPYAAVDDSTAHKEHYSAPPLDTTQPKFPQKTVTYNTIAATEPKASKPPVNMSTTVKPTSTTRQDYATHANTVLSSTQTMRAQSGSMSSTVNGSFPVLAQTKGRPF